MSAPKKCDVCGTEHHAHQAHVFHKAIARVVKPKVSPAVKPVKPPAAEPARSNAVAGKSWRERDPEAYRAYMRWYMAKRRAAGRVS